NNAWKPGTYTVQIEIDGGEERAESFKIINQIVIEQIRASASINAQNEAIAPMSTFPLQQPQIYASIKLQDAPPGLPVQCEVLKGNTLVAANNLATTRTGKQSLAFTWNTQR